MEKKVVQTLRFISVINMRLIQWTDIKKKNDEQEWQIKSSVWEDTFLPVVIDLYTHPYLVRLQLT